MANLVMVRSYNWDTKETSLAGPYEWVSSNYHRSTALLKDPATGRTFSVHGDNITEVPKLKKRKRASYRDGVAWIAYNDDAEERDPEVICGYISTLLLADLFGKDSREVAKAIAKVRESA